MVALVLALEVVALHAANDSVELAVGHLVVGFHSALLPKLRVVLLLLGLSKHRFELVHDENLVVILDGPVVFEQDQVDEALDDEPGKHGNRMKEAGCDLKAQ